MNRPWGGTLPQRATRPLLRATLANPSKTPSGQGDCACPANKKGMKP
jgi:hypothetical protein